MDLADFVYFWATKFSAPTLTGRFMRMLLSLLPPDLVLPSVLGEARGIRWVVGSSLPGVWLGTYQLEMQVAFRQHLRSGDTLYDVGSNVGVFALLGSRLVGREGHVVAFEPLAQNLAALNRHVELNRCKNVTVVPLAVSNLTGVQRMVLGESVDPRTAGLLARLSPGGTVEVQTITLDEAVSRLQLPKCDAIKIDVEGAELLVLEGGRRTIEEFRPTIFLSTHGEELRSRCLVFLQSEGYRAFSLRTPRVVPEDEFIAVHKAERPSR